MADRKAREFESTLAAPPRIVPAGKRRSKPARRTPDELEPRLPAPQSAEVILRLIDFFKSQ